SHPGMRFRASFEGEGFNDTCLSLTYLAAGDDEFDTAKTWARAGRHVLPASNRLRYLRWGLRRAVETKAPMFAEHCAREIFCQLPDDRDPRRLFSDRNPSWYAERIHAVRERLDAAFADNHTISALARAVGMSMFHFTRVFTELVGRPPHRYLA